jgi:hypothetical protein
MAIKVNQQTVISDSSTLENIASATFTGTSALKLPAGTTAQRPVSPVEGMFRFNTSTSNYEKYFNGVWEAFTSDEPLGDTIKMLTPNSEIFLGAAPLLFEITNYDSEKTYTISTTNGTITRNEEILTYTASTVGEASFTVNSRTFTFTVFNETLAPVGLIIPYTDSLPSDGSWVDYNVENLFIVGASTTAPVTTSSTTSVNVGSRVSSSNAHTGALAVFDGLTSVTVESYVVGTNSSSHTHTATGNITTDPVNQQYKLAKCVATSALPKSSYLLASQTLSNVTNVTITDVGLCLAKSASLYTGAAGGSSTRTCEYVIGESGNHTHGSNYAYAADSGTQVNSAWGQAAGGHTHTATSFTATDTTKQKILSAWTNAVRRFGVAANGIAMWDGATAPTGWEICDGTNGTPDMRDFYLVIGNTGQHGTGSGDNTYTFPARTSASNGAHEHELGGSGLTDTVNTQNAYHRVSTNSHTHTFTSFTITSRPRFLSLVFVRKIP